MANPRRTSFSSASNSHTPDGPNPFHYLQSSPHYSPLSLSSIIFFLKKPQAIPFLLSLFLLLTWLSFRLQHHGFLASTAHRKWTVDDDALVNLVRFKAAFPSQITRDKRGWLIDPVAAASDAGISGGAVSCASVHLGEIRPGGLRGNHRHNTCNETFLIWGAKTVFRLENRKVADKGYAEATIEADEVVVVASPSGTAHALVNVDHRKITYFLGCQDSIINYNSSTTDFNVWKDL